MRKIAAFFFLFFAPVAYGQVNVSGSQIQIGGSAPAVGNCTVETANFSAAAASCYVGNAASGITATLPAISTGAIIRIQNINAGTVTASFGSNFNCTLNGATTSTTTCAIANGSTALATTDGTSWYVTVTPTATGGSSLPSGTTNQLLYYAAPGTTVTPLTLGTNLSIASGTLNAAGGSAVIGVQHTFTFSSAGSQTFTHNLGLQYPFYSCATTSGATFDPTWMTWVDANNVTMTAPAATDTVCNFGQSNTATSLSNPAACPDTSGSGTAQSCTTTPTITVAANACIAYSTTTDNSGTGLTIAVNGGGGAPVAIRSCGTWTTTLSSSPATIQASHSYLMCYDGTDWDVQTATGGCGGGSVALNPFSGSSPYVLTGIVGANWTAIGGSTGGGGTPGFSVINGIAGTNSAINITSPTGGGTNGPWYGVETAVSGSWTHTFVVNASLPAGYSGTGCCGTGDTVIGVTDGTKWEGISFGNYSTTSTLNYATVAAAEANTGFTASGTISNPAGRRDYTVSASNFIIFQLSWNSSTHTITGSYSPDGGVTFIQTFSDATPFLTPSAVCVLTSTRGGSIAYNAFLESYQ